MKRYFMLLVITFLLIPFQSFEQENYHTPEQTIPSKPLPYPWESKAMQIRINAFPGKKVKQLTALGHNKKLSFKKDGNDVVVDLPADWKSRIRVIRIE